MSKRGYLSRYLMVLKKLKSKPYSSYEELRSFIERQVEFLQLHDDSLMIGFSKRTLQRDIREIKNIFGIDIQFSTRGKGYFISQDEMETMNFQRMMEAFDMFNSLNLSSDLTPYIHLENRKPQGTENLYGLLHAIKNCIQIKFDYKKFWEDDLATRTAEPYAVKEFKNRWYLIAKDLKDKSIKTFALDRFSNLEITKKQFVREKRYNVDDAFRYSFGIISPTGEEPQDVVLSFDPFQGKYIKTLPLHSTQQVLIDNEEELRISLRVFITHDLVMEILSFGENVKVLAPKQLIREIKSALRKASHLYN
jgi:proteasome accessory factor B